MHEDMIKRLRNCISDTVEDCVGCPYQGGYKGTYCMNGLISEAADAIEERDRRILTLQHEMMTEAESHTALVERLNKQIEELQKNVAYWQAQLTKSMCGETLAELKKPRWIPVTERLPECDLGAEVGNIEWISCGRVYAGCFGRGGKYRDAYFRTWTDAGEGMDAKDADYWRAVTLPKPPKEGS